MSSCGRFLVSHHGGADGIVPSEIPQDYDSLSTSYGNKADLQRCIAALDKEGVKAIADIVINHRCAQQQV